MKTKRFFKKSFVVLILSSTIISCTNDDDSTPQAEEDLNTPTTYTFSRNGQNNFEGSIYGEYSEQLLNNLFTNQGGLFTNAFLTNTILEEGDLNQSSRQIRNTVADSEDYFEGPGSVVEPANTRAFLELLISRQVTEVFPAINQVASPGNAGQLPDGSSTRFVNSDGWELNEVFEKSLIGSLQLDQVINNYISSNLLDQGANRENNNNKVPRNDSGTDTQMEHFWDEGFGYIYGLSCDIENVTRDLGENDGNFNNYLDLVNDDQDFRGISDQIFIAFITGRAAIVANNYNERDRQTAILRELLSKVMAVRTVYYLQQGKIKLEAARAGSGEYGDAFHDISEGMGFLLGLRYTQNPNTNQPYYSAQQVQDFFDTILTDGNNGLWGVTSETLDTISDTIAAPFGFTRAMAPLVANNFVN